MTRSNKKSQIQNNPTQTVNQSKTVMAELKLERIMEFLPNFDLEFERNIDQFIKDWETLEKPSKLCDEIKLILFKSKFTGLASERIYNSKNLSNEYSYTEFKKKIREEFKIHYDFEKLQHDFLQLRQKPNEDMEQFIRKFNNVTALFFEGAGDDNNASVNSFLNKMKISRFLEAIRDDIAFEIRKIAPNSFTKACELALKLERAFSYAFKEQINYVQVTPENANSKLLYKNIKQYQDKIDNLEKYIQNLEMENLYFKNSNQSDYEYCNMVNYEYCNSYTQETQNAYLIDKIEGSQHETNSYYCQMTKEENLGSSQMQNSFMQNFPNVSQQNLDTNNFDNYGNVPYQAPMLQNLSPQTSEYKPTEHDEYVNKGTEEMTEHRQTGKLKVKDKPSSIKRKRPKVKNGDCSKKLSQGRNTSKKGHNAHKQSQGQKYVKRGDYANKQPQGLNYVVKRADNRDCRATNNGHRKDIKSYDRRCYKNKTSYDKHKVKKKYQ